MEERHGGRREVRKKKKKKNVRSVCTDCRRIKISRTDAAGKGLWGMHCTALHCTASSVLYGTVPFDGGCSDTPGWEW